MDLVRTKEEVRTRPKLPSNGSLSAVMDLVQLIDEGSFMQEDQREDEILKEGGGTKLEKRNGRGKWANRWRQEFKGKQSKQSHNIQVLPWREMGHQQRLNSGTCASKLPLTKPPYLGAWTVACFHNIQEKEYKDALEAFNEKNGEKVQLTTLKVVMLMRKVHVLFEGHSIYIRNLPLNVTAAKLELEFKKFGPIKPGGIQVRNNKLVVTINSQIANQQLDVSRACIVALHLLRESSELQSEENKVSNEKNKKRKLKTPAQLKALENFYNEHKYPTEEMKLVLAEELGLTEKQISGWFCHRRLKDKRLMKDEAVANGRQDRSSGVIQDRGSGLGQDSCGSSKHADHRYLDPKEVESHGLYNHELSVADMTHGCRNRYPENVSGVDDT
ncbi:hypothetical protein JHK84_042880 [Glycine max]|nr:hypothetical protein JHK84_042880 [Glycine max]